MALFIVSLIHMYYDKIESIEHSLPLHVRNILDLEFTASDSLLGIHHGHKMCCLSTLQGLLKALEGTALKTLGTEPAKILGLLFSLLLRLEFLPGFLSKATWDVLELRSGRGLAVGGESGDAG